MIVEGEEHLLLTLKALVEEFGAERVTVSLPKAWSNPSYNLGPVKLRIYYRKLNKN